MTFREAIVRDSLGGRLPLHWRRRVARWHAWNRAQIRKLDRLHSGSHRRWIEWEYRESLWALFDPFDPPRQPNEITITETP